MVRTPAVADYVVEQADRGIDVSVLAYTGCDIDALRSRLQAALAGAGLRSPRSPSDPSPR
jgi:hypothetical protein